MKKIVIYNSQTGFTKKYAKWIAEETNSDCLELKEAKKQSLDNYDTIVFGGWSCAGSISKLKWFKAHIEEWEGKNLIVFCVGGSPIESPEVAGMLNNCFNEKEHEKVKIFYFPGGINYEKMPGPSKLMLKMFRCVCNAKKEKTESEKEMVKMLNASYDISDKKYIESIVEYLNTNSTNN